MNKEKGKEQSLNNIKSIDTKSYTKLLELENKHKVTLVTMIYIFIICAVIGWFVELGYVYLTNGKIVNRGMTYGPYCSIYGVGALILYLIFHNTKITKKNIPYTFFATAIIMGSFELLCGLGFKHILGIEMWSYDGQFLEILDYTTVPILIGWGVLSTIFVFLIQPTLLKIIDLIPKNIVKSIATIIAIVYLLDFSFSVFNIHLNPEILYKLVNPTL